MRDFLITGILAAMTGTLALPMFISLAVRLGFVDKPDSHHKRHGNAVPLGGGILVFISGLVGLGGAALISSMVRNLLANDVELIRGILLASLLLLAVGVVDDSRGMRGRHKLLGQIVAALVLAGHGLHVQQIELLGHTFQLGVLSVPFTLFWILGAINSFNLLDGLDGFAGTIALITSLAIACVAILAGHALAALVAVAVAGGVAAFLNGNLPPARIYLGDAGSMLIGMLLGALSLLACFKGPGLLSIAPAAGLLLLPIMDSAAAMLRRRLTGRSVFETDRGHLHHRFLEETKSHQAALLVVALACMAVGAAATWSVFQKNDLPVLAASLLAVGILVAMRLFGNAECRLIAGKVATLHFPWHRQNGAEDAVASIRQSAVRMQGDREWHLLWESLQECTDKLDVSRIDLDVNLAAEKEGFHAHWRRPTAVERNECWRAELPLFFNNVPVGRLDVWGERDGASCCEAIQRLMDMLSPFEQAFSDVAALPGAVAKTDFQRTLAEGRTKRMVASAAD